MRYVITTIWLVLSGCVIYNLVYDNNEVSIFLYIFLCWISSAPLAGCVIIDTQKEELQKDEKISTHAVTFISVGLIIGGIVSIVDFIFFSKGVIDFVCDLIEIGFGYFAILSVFVGSLIVSYCKSKAEEENKRFEEEFENELIKIRQENEKKIQDILAIIGREGERGLTKAQMNFYREYQEKEREKREAEKERRRREKEAEIRAQEFEKKLKNLKKEFIEDINNTLSQSSYGEYVIIGAGDYYESRYGLDDYPVKSLKRKTEEYIEKLAKMTDEQLREEHQRAYVAGQKIKAWEEGFEERAERAMRIM